jgi:hypothetical protein
MRRKLCHLASLGIISGYGNVTPIAGPQSAQARRERDGSLIMQFALASPERIEKFRTKLDRLDRASAQALAENEEKLRKAGTELQRIRERAYEVTMPDGTIRKVYRDGNTVRDDDGNEISPDIIRAEDIPNSFPTWPQREGAEEAAREAERAYREVLEYRERLERARKASEGQPTEQEINDLEAEINRMPVSVRHHYEALSPDQRSGITPQAPSAIPTFRTDLRPTQPFATAASGIAPVPQLPADDDFNAVIPGVSRPAPM